MSEEPTAITPTEFEVDGQTQQFVPYEAYMTRSQELASATRPTGMVDESGAFLSEEWTEEQSMRDRFKDVGTLAKSYRELEALVGKDKLPLPSPDSPPEAWETFNSKVDGLRGVPDTIDGYEIKAPDDLPDGFPVDEDRINSFREIAKELKLTPDQAQRLAAFDFEAGAKAYTEFEGMRTANLESSVAALKQEWGMHYDSNLELGRTAARASGIEGLADDPVLANHPAFVKFAAWAGSLASERTLAGGRSPATFRTVDQEIDEMMGRDERHPLTKAYWDSNDPNHMKAIQHMERLRTQKNPGLAR